jgi:tRNA/tmRNA/rRNA uracil-C5-methylase (TrmA/RlmC/RlmD family)
VLADDEVNAIFRDIDNFARAYHLPTYDPKTAQGFWRHLVIRKAKKTGETMILWSLNTDFPGYTAKEQTDLRFFNETLVTRHPNIVSIHILANTGRADIVTGETECIF